MRNKVNARTREVPHTVACSSLGLVDGLDDTNGNGLSHVTDGANRPREGDLYTAYQIGQKEESRGGNGGTYYRLTYSDELDDARVTHLDELGVVLD